MARRAGVIPFSLSSVTVDRPLPEYHSSPTRGQIHSWSQSRFISGAGSSSASRYSRPTTAPSYSSSKESRSTGGRTIAAKRESTPKSAPATSPSDGFLSRDGFPLAENGERISIGLGRGGQVGQMLPSVAKMTTGPSLYSTPAYTMLMPMSTSTGEGGYASPGPLLPAISSMGIGVRQDIKRRASLETCPRDTSRRRQ